MIARCRQQGTLLPWAKAMIVPDKSRKTRLLITTGTSTKKKVRERRLSWISEQFHRSAASTTAWDHACALLTFRVNATKCKWGTEDCARIAPRTKTNALCSPAFLRMIVNHQRGSSCLFRGFGAAPVSEFGGEREIFQLYSNAPGKNQFYM